MTAVLKLSEAAELLRISERTVVKLAIAGTIPGRKVGGQWRFLRTDLEAYVHGSSKQAAS